MKKNTVDRVLYRLSIAFIFACLISGCTETDQKKEWKPILIGNYWFDFPEDFELVEREGIDSYVGEVKSDDIDFSFDYGIYSNHLGDTPEDYISNGSWKQYIAYKFMKEGVTYTEISMPEIEVLSMRKANAKDSMTHEHGDYIVQCKHEDSLFDYPLEIPLAIKAMNYQIDTLDGHIYRKIVYSKNPAKGITAIYLKDIKDPDNDFALNLVTDKLSKQQQDTVLKIFSTVRIYQKK